jgi:hypothetical protein
MARQAVVETCLRLLLLGLLVACAVIVHAEVSLTECDTDWESPTERGGGGEGGEKVRPCFQWRDGESRVFTVTAVLLPAKLEFTLGRV